MAGNIGASVLQGVAGELEQALKQGTSGPPLEALLCAFDNTLIALTKALDQSLPGS